jgi:hypothetical protein
MWMKAIEGEESPEELSRAVRMVRAIDEETLPLRKSSSKPEE